MKRLLFLLTSVAMIAAACGTLPPGKESDKPGVAAAPSRAYQLGKLALTCTANDTERFSPRPTVTSRILALVWTSVFDAWSRYDANAIPVCLKEVARRPEHEQTLRNKEIAITYAAYRTMLEYYFADSVLLRDAMAGFGLDPDDQSLDPETPAGIGNLAARRVIEARLHDGANQRGDMSGSNGTAYSDYTNYTPVNTPEELTDAGRWQPKYFSDGKGGRFAPACLTPHWHKVKPLMIDSAAQFRPGPPPALHSDQLQREVAEVVELQASLTPEQKALVEFMRDGPRSVQQAGHWLIFSQAVSVRDQHALDQDVKMYFLVQAAAMDAFIAVWDAKMHYDFARPYALVHEQFGDRVIRGWGGPGKGMIDMKGTAWRPYSPETFLCPAFPAYVSGHSAVSAACAEALRLFTGHDEFNEKVTWLPGCLTDPGHAEDSVTLHFPTFTETANMAGISRVLGGYHIRSDNVEGLRLGRRVAGRVWERYSTHVGAPAADHGMTGTQQVSRK